MKIDPDDIDFEDFNKWLTSRLNNILLTKERLYDCADTYIMEKHGVIIDNYANKIIIDFMIELGYAEIENDKFKFTSKNII